MASCSIRDSLRATFLGGNVVGHIFTLMRPRSHLFRTSGCLKGPDHVTLSTSLSRQARLWHHFGGKDGPARCPAIISVLTSLQNAQLILNLSQFPPTSPIAPNERSRPNNASTIHRQSSPIAPQRSHLHAPRASQTCPYRLPSPRQGHSIPHPLSAEAPDSSRGTHPASARPITEAIAPEAPWSALPALANVLHTSTHILVSRALT